MEINLADVLGALCLLLTFVFLVNAKFFHAHRIPSTQLPPVPAVPGGLPLLGNLLQLKEKKPFKTFTRWAEVYGPIYSIKLGYSHLIVLNSTHLAKEALISRFSSITNKKLSAALRIVSGDKSIVVASDYNQFYKLAKSNLLTHLLGSSALKRYQGLREAMVTNLVSHFNSHVDKNSENAVNFRDIFVYEVFGFALKLALGRDVQSIHVDELGTTFTRKDLYRVLVVDIMDCAIEVDWRDLFPYLKWIPNSLETRLETVGFIRLAVMKALIKEMKELKIQADSKEEMKSSYLNLLRSEADENGEDSTQLAMFVWEVILQLSDSPAIATEWAVFELAKDHERQKRLYQEIEMVCGSKKISEDELLRLPYLSAVFHETLRKHSPLPILPIRNVHEDTQVGGYHIPAGSEITVNVYGCNRNKNQWEDPDEWKPERFLDDQYSPSDLYKTMGFGSGKRACLGASLAMILSCLSIGRLVQEFEWRLKEGEEEDVDTVGITTHKLHPLHVVVKPRSLVL